MTVSDSFTRLMTDTITIARFGSRNEYGEDTYGTPFTALCRISGRLKMVRSSTGEEVVSTKTIYLEEVLSLTTEDQITLPDGSVAAILSISVFNDNFAPDHETVYVA